MSNPLLFKKTILFIICIIFLAPYGLASPIPGNQPMLTKPRTQPSIANYPRNLNHVEFSERETIEKKVDQLITAADNPYAASLPLMASATLGDSNRYERTLKHMLDSLNTLEASPEQASAWMRSPAFKAWMWGRIVTAATAMNDAKTTQKAQATLAKLLNNASRHADHSAFFVWAWGYRAASGPRAYQIAVKPMMQGALTLTNHYKEHPSHHEALSNALWAWIMNLSAAAIDRDQKSYGESKKQIMQLTGKDSVALALESGLIRNAQTNDYPAWALAKLRLAAAIMKDKQVFQETDPILTASLATAKASHLSSAKAEYVLAVLDNELANQTAKPLPS